MSDTKEKILMAALRLFSENGYEAVSVSDIAGELGITKGALYRHYGSKRDIFDSIVARMFQADAERASAYGVPEETAGKAPDAYYGTGFASVRTFTLAQFEFWTSDAFASSFRRMLVLEQYRNPEMNELYQNCIVRGPVEYMRDIFAAMLEKGEISGPSPETLAVEFYAPMFLLISMADGRTFNGNAHAMLAEHIDGFIRRHARTVQQARQHDGKKESDYGIPPQQKVRYSGTHGEDHGSEPCQNR